MLSGPSTNLSRFQNNQLIPYGLNRALFKIFKISDRFLPSILCKLIGMIFVLMSFKVWKLRKSTITLFTLPLVSSCLIERVEYLLPIYIPASFVIIHRGIIVYPIFYRIRLQLIKNKSLAFIYYVLLPSGL
jgi:hypothetical protein